jgi:hypothetical protein
LIERAALATTLRRTEVPPSRSRLPSMLLISRTSRRFAPAVYVGRDESTRKSWSTPASPTSRCSSPPEPAGGMTTADRIPRLARRRYRGA